VKWQSNKILFEFFGYTLSISFHLCTHVSPDSRTVGSFAVPVPKRPCLLSLQEEVQKIIRVIDLGHVFLHPGRRFKRSCVKYNIE
jgi:hypothetical protein